MLDQRATGDTTGSDYVFTVSNLLNNDQSKFVCDEFGIDTCCRKTATPGFCSDEYKEECCETRCSLKVNKMCCSELKPDTCPPVYQLACCT